MWKRNAFFYRPLFPAANKRTENAEISHDFRIDIKMLSTDHSKAL